MVEVEFHALVKVPRRGRHDIHVAIAISALHTMLHQGTHKPLDRPRRQVGDEREVGNDKR